LKLVENTKSSLSYKKSGLWLVLGLLCLGLLGSLLFRFGVSQSLNEKTHISNYIKGVALQRLGNTAIVHGEYLSLEKNPVSLIYEPVSSVDSSNGKDFVARKLNVFRLNKFKAKDLLWIRGDSITDGSGQILARTQTGGSGFLVRVDTTDRQPLTLYLTALQPTGQVSSEHFALRLVPEGNFRLLEVE
jgi:hypothetical protein